MRIQTAKQEWPVGTNRHAMFTEVPDGEEYKEKGLNGRMTFRVQWEGSSGDLTEMGQFTLEPFPGCCGIVVSTASYLNEKQRGQHNVSRWFHELKEMTAKHFGYKVMIMSTQLRNIPEVVGASRARWRFFHYFRNSRTDNDIGIAIKDI